MPEHVHLLTNEPQIASLAIAIQVWKQQTSRKLKNSVQAQFWQRRYCDFNVFTAGRLSKSLNTCIGIRSIAGWLIGRRIGHGRAFGITQQDLMGRWRLNRNGWRGDGPKRQDCAAEICESHPCRKLRVKDGAPTWVAVRAKDASEPEGPSWKSCSAEIAGGLKPTAPSGSLCDGSGRRFFAGSRARGTRRRCAADSLRE